MGVNKKVIFIAAILSLAFLQNFVWGDKGNFLFCFVSGCVTKIRAVFQVFNATKNLDGNSTFLPRPHPLDPLSALEITQSSNLIRTTYPDVDWMFIWITLQEPEKSLLLPYFLNDTEPPEGIIQRRVLVIALHPVTGITYEGVIRLEDEVVEEWGPQSSGADTTFAADEMSFIADLALNDPLVKERLKSYGHFYGNKSNVVTDVWKYGFMNDKPQFHGKRVAQVFFYGRNFPNDNFYAHPMGFIAIVDTLRGQVLELEEIPIHESFATNNREGDKVPEAEGNYDPDVSGRWYRDDHSITIGQENGPSFSIQGGLLKWQKFRMRLGRNGREGLVLYNVKYNDTGTFRPLIYRASLSELFVPYADPRPPYHRKMALDVGEYGMGFSSSELRSPEACRGSVYFMDAINNNMKGKPSIVSNAFCIYEEDAGILWRKMDPVTKRIVTARGQRLVLTFIATVANYDYQFKWIFAQDASIRVEVVLTGIVSQNLLGTNATPGGHGTIAMPQINAQFHQHFFCVRLDTEFDGNRNTVSTVDVVPDENPAGSSQNPYGNAFHVHETILRTPSEARTKVVPEKARKWRITGEPTNLNPISKSPKGWKLIPDQKAQLMMKSDSVLHPKNAFVDYDVWVTPYRENQLFAAGFYLNESGLPEWVANNPDENIVNEDIVLWHVFGVTHVVRVEDLPVMPAETIGFWLKPANFFTENPGIDVRPIVRHPAEVTIGDA